MGEIEAVDPRDVGVSLNVTGLTDAEVRVPCGCVDSYTTTTHEWFRCEAHLAEDRKRDPSIQQTGKAHFPIQTKWSR